MFHPIVSTDGASSDRLPTVDSRRGPIARRRGSRAKVAGDKKSTRGSIIPGGRKPLFARLTNMLHTPIDRDWPLPSTGLLDASALVSLAFDCGVSAKRLAVLGNGSEQGARAAPRLGRRSTLSRAHKSCSGDIAPLTAAGSEDLGVAVDKRRGTIAASGEVSMHPRRTLVTLVTACGRLSGTLVVTATALDQARSSDATLPPTQGRRLAAGAGDTHCNPPHRTFPMAGVRMHFAFTRLFPKAC
jgi:hypothetical protein